MDERRRLCSLEARVKELTRPGQAERDATIAALGPETLLLEVPHLGELPERTQLSVEFHLPTYPKPIVGIARVAGRTGDTCLAEFVHLPLFEKNIILIWLADGPGPESPAAWLRVG